jgi:hypothetical protein
LYTPLCLDIRTRISCFFFVNSLTLMQNNFFKFYDTWSECYRLRLESRQTNCIRNCKFAFRLQLQCSQTAILQLDFNVMQSVPLEPNPSQQGLYFYIEHYWRSNYGSSLYHTKGPALAQRINGMFKNSFY